MGLRAGYPASFLQVIIPEDLQKAVLEVFILKELREQFV